MGIQRIPVRQVAATSDDYVDFGHQMIGMMEPYSKEFIAQGGEITVDTGHLYVPNTDQLKVFVNGILQQPAEGYIEVNTSTIQFTEELMFSDFVVIRIEGAGAGTTFIPGDHIHIDMEIPVGAINDVNTLFYTSNIPLLRSTMLFINGILQSLNDDYTVDGRFITFIEAPWIGDKILISYRALPPH